MKTGLMLLWFAVGFIVTNALVILHVFLSKRKLEKIPSNAHLTSSYIVQTAYRKSSPVFPLYYLVVWMFCSYFYFAQHVTIHPFVDAVVTAVVWFALTMILEQFFGKLILNRYDLQPKEIRKHSKIWISVCYYIVLISPITIALILFL
jgi:hypothetical protein